MNKNPKYRHFVVNNMVVAVSSFAGKKVRGVAKCNPNDTFDIEKGKALAEARCAEKIAKKRLKRAYERTDAAKAELYAATKRYADAFEYEAAAEQAYNKACAEVLEVLNSF